MIVVTGASGNVGAALVHALTAAGEKVVGVCRRPPAVGPPGVEYRAVDLAAPADLAPALDGAEALFLLVPDAGLDPHALLEVAGTHGVRHVVLLSSQAVRTRPGAASHAHVRAFEAAVGQSGLSWTVLRPGGLSSNALWWARAVRERRTVVAPFGEVGLPIVDPADVGEVAATVLRDRRHAGRTYELTGPALISPRRQARVIGEAIGAPVTFVEQNAAEARAQLRRFMPEPVADGTLAILSEPTAEETRISPDVERVLGRAPRTFTAWAARTAAAFH